MPPLQVLLKGSWAAEWVLGPPTLTQPPRPQQVGKPGWKAWLEGQGLSGVPPAPQKGEGAPRQPLPQQKAAGGSILSLCPLQAGLAPSDPTAALAPAGHSNPASFLWFGDTRKQLVRGTCWWPQPGERDLWTRLQGSPQNHGGSYAQTPKHS